ncbi:MAG TPA: NAD(P)H-dependent oxidoreductase [Cyclobacteriaceae bacterium]|nr:NAD(P)H-dependent oxidoreductase [Cyclobacteriaceae bacterium]
MKKPTITIVIAHPEKKSFTFALAAETIALLQREQLDYNVSDLYEEKFNPVVEGDEFTNRFSKEYFNVMNEQVYASLTDSLPADIRREHSRLDQSDLVIFHFPFWWWSVPAILKGWFDRVLSKGYAYGDVEKLKGKRALMVITAETTGDRFTIDGRKKHDILYNIEEGVLGYVGMKIIPAFVAHDILRISVSERKKIIENYRAYLAQILHDNF